MFRRRTFRPAAHREPSDTPVDEMTLRLAQRRSAVEAELLAATDGASLCAISRSRGQVDGVKYLEGRVAALMQLGRELRDADDRRSAIAAVTDEWHAELDAVTSRAAGPAWVAYRAGGVDELDELLDALTSDVDTPPTGGIRRAGSTE